LHSRQATLTLQSAALCCGEHKREDRNKVQALDYAAPQTLDEAISLLNNGGETARVLAGGTDVIVQAREHRRNISLMVDVKHIAELCELGFQPDGGLKVGAAVPCDTIYTDDRIRREFPALVDSASLIGGIQIQSRASLGGNLCNSSPAADSIPTLIVLDGVCQIAGPSGRREVPVEQFCTGPGRNVLQKGELLVSITFPAPKPHSGAAFQRFIPRNEMDIAVVNCAASVVLDAAGQRIEGAKLALGAVAPTPLLVTAAADAIGPEAYERAAEAARQAANPITDMRGSIAQRKHLAGVFAKRVLEQAVQRAQGG
jgi:carbon-monoxide dehydrogenase medium subunit